MTDTFDRTKTLDELEDTPWPDPEYQSHLVLRCHALRKKPVAQFDVEDLRIMIGQNIGLQFLVPLALEVLRGDPLAKGDFYPGDLLVSVLRVDPRFWRGEPDFRARVMKILDNMRDVPVEVSGAIGEFREQALELPAAPDDGPKVRG